ncbi:MAG: tetratricopeptide repeat protein [Deltaproteobacteria bacterium]|nr:tetratricopeptide repeat protein [Deltaproteobacteria bacterium]
MTPALRNGASHRISGGLVSSLLALGLSIPTLAFAADEASVLRARAAQLATKGDCASALPLIDQAKAIDPAGDGAAALMAGRCLLSMEKFAEAKPALERAVANDPDSGDARLALGVAKYHLGEKDAARADLEAAQKMLPDNPEAELYLGMILLEEERPAEAINRLDRSRSLNGDTVEPASDYYAALAHSEAGDRKRAEEALRRVQQTAPGTIWAERAGEALDQAEARRLAGTPRRWVTAQAGLDYDSNVALRSDSIAQPNNISSKGDGRGWWALDGGAELFRKNGWSGGAGAAYNGTHPFKAEDFDQHFVKANLWLDRELGSRTTLRISPEGGYGFFDEKAFYRYLAIRPELRHDFGRAGMGTAYVRYAYNDFRYEEFIGSAPVRNIVDRDGHDVIAGYDHQIAVTDSLTLRGGAFGRDYTAEGSEYDFSGGGGWLGFRQTLPLELILSVTGRVEYDAYESASSFREPTEIEGRRRDVIGRANAVLTKPINEWLSVSARYQYLNNDSNTNVFDYDRHIVGAFVTIGLLR